MILNQITLEDFISHKKTQIDLGLGINVIIGPNGAGKTSILDGISFALFNDYSGRGKKENLINSKAKKCKVKLGFTEAGIAYCVDWSMERKGAASGSFFRIVDGKNQILARTAKESLAEIQKVLGIDKNMFVQSVYVRQGEIEQLVNARPADRKELISRLLGVEDLDLAWNGIKEVIDVYRDKKNTLEGALARRSEVEKGKGHAESELKHLEKVLTAKQSDKAKLESELKELQETLNRLDAKKKDFEGFDKEKGLVAQKIAILADKLEREKDELGQATSAESIVQKLLAQVSKLPLLEAYVSSLSEKEKLEEKIDALDKALNEIGVLRKNLSKNKAGYDLYHEKEALLAETNKSRKEFEGSDVALTAAKRQLGKYIKEAEKRASLLLKEIEKCSSALGEPVSVDNVDAVLLRVKLSHEERMKELEIENKKLTREHVAVVQRIKDLEGNIVKFSSEIDSKTCPTCESELSKERISQLLHKYSEEKKTICGRLVMIEGAMGKSEQTLKKEDTFGKQIVAVNPEQLRRLASDLDEADSEVSRAQTEVDKLGKLCSKLVEIDAVILKLEAERKTFEQAFKEYDFAERQLERLPSDEDVQMEKTPLTDALKKKCAELEGSVQKLGYQPVLPQKELEQLRLTKQEYDQNLPIAKRKSEYESKTKATSMDLQENQNAFSGVVKSIEALGYDENENDQLKVSFQTQEKNLNELEKENIRLDQQKVGFQNEASKLNLELKDLEAKALEKQYVGNYIIVLNQIRDAYGKDGIQKMIRSRARPVIEKVTRDLFERFNLAFSDIKIDDDYNISVLGSAGKQDIDQISGGERVALAIALRLAIAQVLSGKIETIIMDEPTTHLDEQRRKELVNILNAFFREGGRIIPQMLIITHHPEIEDVADIIYTIRKDESYSVTEKNHVGPDQQ